MRIGIAAGGVAVLVGVLAGAHGLVARTLFSPDEPVLAYVNALEEGRADDAMALAGIVVPDARGTMLTDAVYADVADRPTGARVTKVVREGDVGIVTVQSEQAGATVSQEFWVRKDGRQGLVFDRWVLDAVEVPTVGVWEVLPRTSDAFVVNGVEHVGASGDFLALPGTYTLSLSVPEGGADLVESTTVEMTVRPDGRLADGADMTTKLRRGFTDAGRLAVLTAATDVVASSCLGAPVLEVDDCGIRNWVTRGDEALDVSWAAKGDPEVTPEINGQHVVVEVKGEATVSYHLPARSFYDAEDRAEDVGYRFWVRFELADGELVNPELDRYGSWD